MLIYQVHCTILYYYTVAIVKRAYQAHAVNYNNAVNWCKYSNFGIRYNDKNFVRSDMCKYTLLYFTIYIYIRVYYIYINCEENIVRCLCCCGDNGRCTLNIVQCRTEQFAESRRGNWQRRKKFVPLSTTRRPYTMFTLSVILALLPSSREQHSVIYIRVYNICVYIIYIYIRTQIIIIVQIYNNNNNNIAPKTYYI